jgi:hypothetical protein
MGDRAIFDEPGIDISGITEAGRTFFALRKDGPLRGRAPVYHAVSPYCRVALCSSEPGVQSGWAEPPADRVTCPVCQRRLERLRKTG